MSLRLIAALIGVVAVLAGHAVDRPAMLVLGLAGCIPLAVRVLSVPARARGWFMATAVAAGFGLAIAVAGTDGPAPVMDPVPVACVAVAS